MKWLIGSLLALVMVSAAFAGEDPYIGIVGNDSDYNSFYFSQKHQQFLYDQTLFSVPVCFGAIPPVTTQTRVGGLGCEQFRSNMPINQPEICDSTGIVNGVGDFTFFGEPNAVVRKQNAGYYEWWIRLPKKPSGEINLVFQCGVLKPNTFAFEEFNAINLCAAETGERIGTGFCTRDQVGANVNPIVNGALPRVTAMAFPGPYSLGFAPFHLTAFRNPGTYGLNAANTQLLDGSNNARIMLKACMDKSVIVKIPVTGFANGFPIPQPPPNPPISEVEADLEAGDLIGVRIDIPITNTVDIYCHSQSLRLAGVGEAPF